MPEVEVEQPSTSLMESSGKSKHGEATQGQLSLARWSASTDLGSFHGKGPVRGTVEVTEGHSEGVSWSEAAEGL